MPIVKRIAEENHKSFNDVSKVLKTIFTIKIVSPQHFCKLRFTALNNRVTCEIEIVLVAMRFNLFACVNQEFEKSSPSSYKTVLWIENFAF